MDVRESLLMLNKVQDLAETGQHSGVLEYLSARPRDEIERSPTLALLYGIAYSRLGQNAEGDRWVELALRLARERGDRAVEAHALNALGATDLACGRIEQAAGRFMEALALAKREGDHATVGRACNNLGIVAYSRGDYGRAVGSFTLALAAFQQASKRAGVAQVLHNLAMTYRDQGDLAKALETADAAVEEAEASGDLRLGASVRGGRAEIRLMSGDAEVARREIERALQTERELGDVVGEAQDLRVLAGALAAVGEAEQAEEMLLRVVAQAEEHCRPVLVAQAERDLAHVLGMQQRRSEALEFARKARVRFLELGAEAEVAKLDQFLSEADR
jgi:tetratricopeptide (TPR) repeat protein